MSEGFASVWAERDELINTYAKVYYEIAIEFVMSAKYISPLAEPRVQGMLF
jgi:hypothetical protein